MEQLNLCGLDGSAYAVIDKVEIILSHLDFYFYSAVVKLVIF